MATSVYWLSRTAADVPPDDAWLAAGEAAYLGRLRVPKRRQDWRLGRWTAKQAVAGWRRLLSSPPDPRRALSRRHTAPGLLEILAAEDGAPEAFLDGEPLGAVISISHSGGRALCAVAAGGAGGTALGCDLETIEERSAAFVRDYFTAGEQALFAARPAAERPLLANLLWSAKESALKALRSGLRLDTRTVEVRLPYTADRGGGGWRPLEVYRLPAGPAFGGWWRRAGEQVMTVVADPAAAVPVELGQGTAGSSPG